MKDDSPLIWRSLLHIVKYFNISVVCKHSSLVHVHRYKASHWLCSLAAYCLHYPATKTCTRYSSPNSKMPNESSSELLFECWVLSLSFSRSLTAKRVLLIDRNFMVFPRWYFNTRVSVTQVCPIWTITPEKKRLAGALLQALYSIPMPLAPLASSGSAAMIAYWDDPSYWVWSLVVSYWNPTPIEWPCMGCMASVCLLYLF